MAWEKSSDELVARFGQVLERFPEAQRRKMFGYPAAFVGGNLVTSLHREDWIVRLPEAQRDEAMAAGGATFDPMGGRPMKAFVALPASIVQDDDAISSWVRRAIEHGRTLPPKK